MKPRLIRFPHRLGYFCSKRAEDLAMGDAVIRQKGSARIVSTPERGAKHVRYWIEGIFPEPAYRVNVYSKIGTLVAIQVEL